MNTIHLDLFQLTAIVQSGARSFLISDLQGLKANDAATVTGKYEIGQRKASATLKIEITCTRLFAFQAPTGYRFLVDFRLLNQQTSEA